MQGRAKEYSDKTGWYVKRIVDKLRTAVCIAPSVIQRPTEDEENYELIEDYKREGVPDPDADYNGRIQL